MAKVIITHSLQEEIFRKFKGESENIFLRMKLLETEPQKGKALCHVGQIVVKEVRYDKFRFYFITDGHILKFGTEDELASLLIKFVRMSEKKDQQKIINSIKSTLHSMGFEGIR